MNAKKLILCGAIAPFFYIAAAIIGGELFLEYSHIKHSVSDLLHTGAPNKMLLDVLMFISNVLTIVGCLTVSSLYIHQLNRAVKSGAVLLLITCVFNIMSSHIFRLPPEGAMNVSGMIHISLVSMTALLSMVVILLIGFGMHKSEEWSFFKKYSIITFMLFLLFGLLSPFVIAQDIPIVGLVERLAVGIYFQWIVVLFIKFYVWQR